MNCNINIRIRKGFTLIELIAVIAIIAILASILILVANGFIQRANTARDQANARNIFNAVSILVAADEINSDTDVTVAKLMNFIDLTNFAKGADWNVTLDFEGSDVVGVLTATFGTATYTRTGLFS